MTYHTERYVEDGDQSHWEWMMRCIECGHTVWRTAETIKDRWDMKCLECQTGTYTYDNYVEKGHTYFGQKPIKITRGRFEELDKVRTKEASYLDKRQQRIARIIFGKFCGILTDKQAEVELERLGAESTWGGQQATDKAGGGE